jgi:hypothetical protein
MFQNKATCTRNKSGNYSLVEFCPRSKPTEMNTNNFKVSASNSCKASQVKPEQKAIKAALAAAKKKPQMDCTIIIARYNWLQRHKQNIPIGIDLPNLCIWVKEGRLERAFYSTTLTHIIKKQRYLIQVLN